MECSSGSSVTNAPVLVVWVPVAVAHLLLVGGGGDWLSERPPWPDARESLLGSCLKRVGLRTAEYPFAELAALWCLAAGQ